MEAKLAEITRTFLADLDWSTALWFTSMMPVNQPRIRPTYVQRGGAGEALGHTTLEFPQNF